MKSAEQVKGAIRNLAKKTGANPNSLLQMCLFEGILEKICKSPYREKFILKGGLLISALIGVENRCTIDMDTTIKGLPMERVILRRVFQEILSYPSESEITYALDNLAPIREDDIYGGYCVGINCYFGRVRAKLNIDITTDDAITPHEVLYNYPRMFGGESIPILSYPVETVLAEKFETITSRNLTTTRARDFYDLYMLYTCCADRIDKDHLRHAIFHTCEKRETEHLLNDLPRIVQLMTESQALTSLWDNYVKANPYVFGLAFQQTLDVYKKIGQLLFP